jgi:hypothetical protein
MVRVIDGGNNNLVLILERWLLYEGLIKFERTQMIKNEWTETLGPFRSHWCHTHPVEVAPSSTCVTVPVPDRTWGGGRFVLQK